MHTEAYLRANRRANAHIISRACVLDHICKLIGEAACTIALLLPHPCDGTRETTRAWSCDRQERCDDEREHEHEPPRAHCKVVGSQEKI